MLLITSDLNFLFHLSPLSSPCPLFVKCPFAFLLLFLCHGHQAILIHSVFLDYDSLVPHSANSYIRSCTNVVLGHQVLAVLFSVDTGLVFSAQRKFLPLYVPIVPISVCTPVNKTTFAEEYEKT